MNRKRRTSTYHNIPEPEFGTVVRTAGYNVGTVGTPGNVGHAIGGVVKGPLVLHCPSILEGGISYNGQAINVSTEHFK